MTNRRADTFTELEHFTDTDQTTLTEDGTDLGNRSSQTSCGERLCSQHSGTAMSCPSAKKIGELVPEEAYPAFVVGWCAGESRRTTQPVSAEIVSDIATMLDAASLTDAPIQPE